MEAVRRFALSVAAMAALGLVPTSGAGGEQNMQCVNVVLDTFGAGLAVHLVRLNAIGFTVTSGQPANATPPLTNGFRAGVVIVPSLCAGDPAGAFSRAAATLSTVVGIVPDEVSLPLFP